jgi:hypothetical protein
MSNYYAEIDATGLVLRVIVADSQAWCEQRLGGTWIATADPYSTVPQAATYCGPGYGAAPSAPERFASPWQMPDPADDGVRPGYAQGGLCYHNGQVWRSTCDDNVTEPGGSSWTLELDTEGAL